MPEVAVVCLFRGMDITHGQVEWRGVWVASKLCALHFIRSTDQCNNYGLYALDIRLLPQPHC